MLIWYFSNNLDLYDYIGKLPEQNFSVWLFFNPGDKLLFLMKFYEARISEWNIQKYLVLIGFMNMKRNTFRLTKRAKTNSNTFFRTNTFQTEKPIPIFIKHWYVKNVKGTRSSGAKH